MIRKDMNAKQNSSYAFMKNVVSESMDKLTPATQERVNKIFSKEAPTPSELEFLSSLVHFNED